MFPGLGSPGECMHEAYGGRGGTKVQGWGPESQRICRACAPCLLPVTCSSVLSNIAVTSLHVSHSSFYPLLWAYSIDFPSWLSLSCRPASAPVFTRPGTHCSLASSPCLSNSAHSAFRSHIRHCLACKGLLNHSNCALPSLLSSLCTLFLCTDVQY